MILWILSLFLNKTAASLLHHSQGVNQTAALRI